MDIARYHLLMQSDSAQLTDYEAKLGWHFCWEFDGLLVGPGMGELHCCFCHHHSHPVYSTAPLMLTDAALKDLF